MLWYYTKLHENDKIVIYAYGWNTKETTGQLLYDKTTEDYSVLKIADNDNQKGAEWALYHLLKVVKKGFPDKDMVIIG
ncbi:MAG: hypothetical protein LBP88_06915 [Treponema sp.]|jgi:hypothetical protein|nr:hypothetical protein [Treponema sp.]